MLEIEHEDEFEEKVLQAKEPVAACFYATWCPFCRRFLPLFRKREGELKGWKFALVKIDEDESPLWDICDIRVIPTVIFFKEGKVAARLDGRPGYGIDERMLAEALERIGSPTV